MTSQGSSSKQLQRIGGIAGILSIIFYFSVAVFSFMPDALALSLAFSFPLLWIIAFMGLYHFLKEESHTASLEIGYIFGIIGGALVCTLLVVQQANIIWPLTSLLPFPGFSLQSMLHGILIFRRYWVG